MNFACRDHLPSIVHSGSPQPNRPLCPAPAPSCSPTPALLQEPTQAGREKPPDKEGKREGGPEAAGTGSCSRPGSAAAAAAASGRAGREPRAGTGNAGRGTSCPHCHPAGSCEGTEPRAMLRLSLLPKVASCSHFPTASRWASPACGAVHSHPPRSPTGQPVHRGGEERRAMARSSSGVGCSSLGRTPLDLQHPWGSDGQGDPAPWHSHGPKGPV